MKQKYIKKANMWLVSIPTMKGKNKAQDFHWFSSEELALKFIENNDR